MKSLKNLKKNKKGFTLVEVIVVLVIIAILVAIAVPSLTGYIDSAKEKAAIADARTVLVAAQTIASENYASKTTTSPDSAGIIKLTGDGIKGTIDAVTVEAGKVTGFTYTIDGYTVTYAAPTFTVKK